MLCNHKENTLLEKSLGEGLGYHFLSLKTVQQEELFQKVKSHKDFAEGFGNGIGQIYDRFDSILQLQILKFIGGTNELDRRFGSITGSSSGNFNDNTDTDAINYQVVTASAGTSMKIAFIAVWGNSAVQVKKANKIRIELNHFLFRYDSIKDNIYRSIYDQELQLPSYL